MPEPKQNIVIAHYRSDIVSGAENSIADFTDQAAERFSITMLVPGEGKLAQFYRSHGFQVWSKAIQTNRRLLPGLHQVQSFLLARELRAMGVKAVLCNTFPAASRVGTACQWAKIPYAIYLRDYTPDTPLYRRILNRATALYAISNDIIRHHRPMLSGTPIRLAYNYIHPDPILDRQKAHKASSARALPFPVDFPVVGLIGRLTPYKQPEVFLHAVPLVLAQVPQARFVLVGSAQAREKPYEESLKVLANSLRISRHTCFLGQRSDVVELTSELAVSTLASGHEPLGRVVLEANLLSIPVVVPDTGGPAEIVQNEITGLHFNSLARDAAQQLANQIIRILTDQAFGQALAAQGYLNIQKTFANREHVRIQEDYIDQLCNTARPG